MPDTSLIHALHRQLQLRPLAPAYRVGDQVYSFADVERLSNRIANRLADLGITRGDRVACLTRQHLPCVLTLLACCKLGAVCMPVNWRLAADELLNRPGF